nr:MAG TPA: HNH endonuclease [Caudoviricetes sp.]
MPYLKKPERIKQTSIKREERNEVYTSTKWRKLRLAHLQLHPLCELCQKEGKVVPAVDVHHITSFMSTNDHLKRIYLAYDPNNLMSLCKECHQKVHNSKACQN